MLLGQKVSERVAGMRTLPPGIDQRSASRHPDWTGPDDLVIKIEELREATSWEVPIYVKVGATRTENDVKLAVAAGADVVVVDGMQGGTGATQDVFIEHAGIPTLPAVRIAAEALRDIGKQHEVQLIVSGGIRSGADVAKALALGATAVSIGVASLISLGCNRRAWFDGNRLGRRCGRLRVARNQPGLLSPLPYRPVPGRHHHPGSDPGNAARPRRRCRLGHELSPGDDDGADHPGPSMWEIQRPQSRARGPGVCIGHWSNHGQGRARRAVGALGHQRVPTRLRRHRQPLHRPQRQLHRLRTRSP